MLWFRSHHLALEEILALHVLPGEGVGRVGHRVVTHAALEDNLTHKATLVRRRGRRQEHCQPKGQHLPPSPWRLLHGETWHEDLPMCQQE